MEETHLDWGLPTPPRNVWNPADMSEPDLSHVDRARVQRLLEEIQSEDPVEAGRLLRDMTSKDAPIWRRYAGALAGNPITWWIGIIQILMVTGACGRKSQINALVRQNLLSQALVRAKRSADADALSGQVRRAVVYLLRHRKTEIIARFHGGAFVSYTTSGGRYGSRVKRPIALKAGSMATNYALASFGVLISTVHKGLVVPDDIVSGVLTGETVHIPGYVDPNLPPDLQEHMQRLDREFSYLHSLMVIEALNNVSGDKPIPMKEFCARPENLKIGGDWCE